LNEAASEEKSGGAGFVADFEVLGFLSERFDELVQRPLV